MAASQKAVVNLVFDKNVIKHTHPEVIQNIDDIADLSASLLSAFTAISANEIAISAIQNDILQISGDINYISAVVSGFEADIIFLSGEINENTIVIDLLDQDIDIISGQVQYISGVVSACCAELSAQNIYLSSQIDNNTTDIQYLSGVISACCADLSATTSGTGLTFKSYHLQTDQLGSDFIAGYYDFASADANLSQALTAITFGSAAAPYAAHASIVPAGSGTVDTGTIGLRVTGTSINDDGVRTASDSDTITTDITTLSANTHYETPKKWLGQISYELFITAGAPTTYSLDFNYGLSKYEDFGNNDFTITNFEVVGKSGGNDANFDVVLYKHSPENWTYAATGFQPGGTEIARLSNTHGGDDNLLNGEYFAFKRANLSEFVNGADSQGLVIQIDTSTSQVIEYLNAHVGVTGLNQAVDVDVADLSAAIDYLSGEIDLNSAELSALSAEIADHQIYTYSGARDSQNASNIYLRGPNGVPTNQSGFMINYDSTLIGIGATTADSETWTAEVRKNNITTSIASLSITASPTGLINNLNVDINAGDEIQLYCNGASINRPHVTVYLIRR